MHDLLGRAQGERLEGEAFIEESESRFWDVGPPGFWKLERRQTFQDPWDESWVAFTNGEWYEALSLLEAQRSEFEDYYRKIDECGFRTWRVRVVEMPIPPYLQWELHLLRLRDELGGSARVVTLDQVERFEKNWQLPELIVLGDDVMYQVLYDDKGLYEGGIRFVDRGLIARCRRFIQNLYAVGEEMGSFFEREVAGLGPPRGVADAHRRAG